MASASGPRRIVLFPYGQPAKAAHRELCVEFLLGIGGDVERMIDGPFADLDRFAAYVKRIAVIREGEKPIIILTKTNPLALMVTNARRKIESLLPQLSRAVWALFVDTKEDPFFAHTARKLGKLDGKMEHVPIWIAPGDAKFMVFSPEVSDFEDVRTRTGEI